METKGSEVSIWTLLNRWLYDGSKSSPMPKELIEDKTIGPQYILYYFRNSIYNLWINEHFNNYDVYQLDRIGVLKFLKQCILDTGYKPKIFPRYKTQQTKIGKVLKKKYPYFKTDDIDLLVKKIDLSADKDRVYETLGLYNPKKKKTTKTKKAEIEGRKKEKITKPTKDKSSLDVFMEGFKIVSK